MAKLEKKNWSHQHGATSARSDCQKIACCLTMMQTVFVLHSFSSQDCICFQQNRMLQQLNDNAKKCFCINNFCLLSCIIGIAADGLRIFLKTQWLEVLFTSKC